MASSAIDEHDAAARWEQVALHYPMALPIDDFISRMEIVLSTFGFTGDNSIAMTNLCRDEVTAVLKDKIEAVFGSSFNTNGLGGVLTCGVSSVRGGLSHSPLSTNGRERYVFFSFPHIAIDSRGKVGAILRHNRAEESCACEGLQLCLEHFRKEGYMNHCREPGVHDPLDPELSILKQRLARRLRYEKTDVSALTLEHLTAVAERTITNDLEYLIERTVDPSKADYAVVTGIQIHNWAAQPNGAPSLEFVAPTKVFVVMNHKKTHLDLRKVPSLSPRQLLLLGGQAPKALQQSYAMEVSHRPRPPSSSTRRGSGQPQRPSQPSPRVLQMQATWQESFSTRTGKERDKAAPTMDSKNRNSALNLVDLEAAAIAAAAGALQGTAGTVGSGGAGVGRGGEIREQEGGGEEEEEEEEDDFNTSFLSRIHNWTGYKGGVASSVQSSISHVQPSLSRGHTPRSMSRDLV